MTGILERFRVRTTDDWHISIARGIQAGETLDYEAPRDAPPYPPHSGWYRNEVFHTSLSGEFEMTGPAPCPYWVPEFGNVVIPGEPRPEAFVGNPGGERGIYTLTALEDQSAYLCMAPRDRATWYRWRANLITVPDGVTISFIATDLKPRQQILILSGILVGNRRWGPEDLFKIAPQTHPSAVANGIVNLLQMWIEP